MKMWVSRILVFVFTLEVLALPQGRVVQAQEQVQVATGVDIGAFVERVSPWIQIVPSNDANPRTATIRSLDPALLPTEYQYNVVLEDHSFRIDVMREVQNGPFEFFTSTTISDADPDYRGKSQSEISQLIVQKLSAFCKVLSKISRFEKSRKFVGEAGFAKRYGSVSDDLAVLWIGLLTAVVAILSYRVIKVGVATPLFALWCVIPLVLLGNTFGTVGLAEDSRKISALVRHQQETLENSEIEPEQYLRIMQEQTLQLLEDPGLSRHSNVYQLRAVLIGTLVSVGVAILLKTFKGMSRTLLFSSIAGLMLPMAVHFINLNRWRGENLGLLDPADVEKEVEREFERAVKKISENRAR